MKRMGILSVACAALLTVACGGDARDNDANRPATEGAAVGTAGDRNAPDATDRKWLEDRIVAGMTEVRLGEIATERAQHADVKAFGSMMVTDHTQVNTELKQLASQHNVQLPADLDDDHRDKVERLSKLEAREFDREYIETMIDDHQNTLEALEDRLDKEGDDENPRYTPKRTDDQFEMALNQAAAKTAPKVREHLAKAKQIKETLDRRTTDR